LKQQAAMLKPSETAAMLKPSETVKHPSGVEEWGDL
jgi:hypothetical protein